jgi:drug/metabolite transporter (DMT)-like permease
MTNSPVDETPLTASHALTMGAVALMWGSSFLLIAVSGDHFAPALVALLRVAFGAGTLALLPGARRPVARSAWPAIIALGAVWMAGPFVLVALAERSIASALAGMLNGAAPLFTALVAALWTRRAPKGYQVVGLLVGFAGVVVICVPTLGSGHSGALGITLVLSATLLYGVAFNLVGALQRAHGALPVIWRAQLVALVLLLVPGAAGAIRSQFAWSSIAAAAALGVFGTALAYVAFTSLAGRVGATRASLTTYLLPAVAIVLGALFRNDHLPAVSLGGIVLVLLGAYGASRVPGAPERHPV